MIKTKYKIYLATILQSIVMFCRHLIGLGVIAKVKRGNVNWSLDLNEGIDFSIWLFGLFELETVRCYRRLVNSGDTVLDIGANIGAHTLFLAELVGKSGRVIAFEPTDYAFSKLTINCELNPKLVNRIQYNQVMLVDLDSSHKSTPKLYSSWPLINQSDVHQQHQGKIKSTDGAQAHTLDSIILNMDIQQVDFIKMDIDGFECSMLKGAKETLTRWHPTIIMELAPYVLKEQGTSLNELVRILTNLDYKFYSLSGNKPISTDINILHKMIPSGSSMNVLAK